MFLAESGRFKGLTKVLPSHGRVGGQTRALQRRQHVDRGREGTNGFFDALIGRCQLELGVEPFEMMTELLSKRQGMIGCGRSRSDMVAVMIYGEIVVMTTASRSHPERS